jgi:hypothetical protein
VSPVRPLVAVFPARANPDVPRREGLTYFLIDMRQPGVEIRPLTALLAAGQPERRPLGNPSQPRRPSNRVSELARALLLRP